MAVLALNVFYRLWLAIILARKVEAMSTEQNEKEGRWPTLDRYYRLGSANYVKGAAVSSVLAGIGLAILYLLKHCRFT